jgi:hypothetical protein
MTDRSTADKGGYKRRSYPIISARAILNTTGRFVPGLYSLNTFLDFHFYKLFSCIRSLIAKYIDSLGGHKNIYEVNGF